MAKKELKIMSWNVEKLKLISRFGGPTVGGVQAARQAADTSVLSYISESIRLQDPAIVCLIESAVQTSVYISDQLRNLLGPIWRSSISNAVRGGEIDPSTPNNRENEVYIVLYNTNKVTLTNPNTTLLLRRYYNEQSQSYQVKNENYMLRAPYGLKFSLPSDPNTERFRLIAIHLQGGGTSAKKELKRLLLLEFLRESTTPVFMAGDFNRTSVDIRSQEGLNNGNDVLSVYNVPPPKNQTTVLSKIDTGQTPPRTPDTTLYTHSVDYRTPVRTGVDDILSFKNGNNVVKHNTSPSYEPQTGIIDLIDEYKDTIYDLFSNGWLHLTSISPQYLVRQQKGPGNTTIDVNYGANLFDIPYDSPSNQPQDVKNKIMYNGWARYLGGISDHLPIIMTIDIDIP